ncbi:MAG: ComEC/Rec2 family competence protein [Bacteroidia bacterium]
MFKQAPLLRVLLPLIAGIIIGIYFPFYHWLTIAVPVVIFAIICTIIFIKKLDSSYQFQPFYGLIFYSFFIASGYSITVNKTAHFHEQHFTKSNIDGLAYGEIAEPLTFKGSSAKALINILAIKNNNNWINTTGKALIYFQKDSAVANLKTGDRIIFEPDFREIKGPQNPSEFNYKQYLAFHLIYRQSYLKSGKWQKVNNGNDYNLKRIAESWRNKLLSIIEQNNITGNEAAVLSALIVGYKDKLDASIVRAYSSSGAMHVLAVSGLHVGIIYVIISSLLFFFDKIKHGIIFKTIIILLFLWAFAFITGLSPSVLRASTMFSFVAVGKAFNRNTNIYNTLAASAILLLLINPYMITEVGFQLSYFAVIGIVAFQKGFYDLFEVKNKWLDKIWQLTTVSIAAQISTFPLGLLYFHQFPNYFLLSNLVVIPLATFIIHAGILMFIISPIPLLSKYAAWATDKLLFTLNYSVNYFEKLPYAITDGIYITVTETILIFLIIIFISIYLFEKHIKYLFISLFLTAIILGYNAYEKLNQKQQKVFAVYNIPGISAFNFIDGKDNILFTDLKLLNDENKLTFHLKNNWIKAGLDKEKVVSVKELNKSINFKTLYIINNTRLYVRQNFISFYAQRIFYLNNDLIKYLNPGKKIDVDYIIISNNAKIKLSDIVKCFNFKKIIIDSSNSNYKTDNWLKEAIEAGINAFSVRDKGAFYLDFSR